MLTHTFTNLIDKLVISNFNLDNEKNINNKESTLLCTYLYILKIIKNNYYGYISLSLTNILTLCIFIYYFYIAVIYIINHYLFILK